MYEVFEPFQFIPDSFEVLVRFIKAVHYKTIVFYIIIFTPNKTSEDCSGGKFEQFVNMHIIYRKQVDRAPICFLFIF